MQIRLGAHKTQTQSYKLTDEEKSFFFFFSFFYLWNKNKSNYTFIVIRAACVTG